MAKIIQAPVQETLNEIQIMVQIQTKKIEGFSQILDFGEVPDGLAKKLRVKNGSSFIIMSKLGCSVKDVQFEDE